VPVNFLYFFTTTEVRAARDNLSTRDQVEPIVLHSARVAV
jgi:hypothetical protein